MKMKLWGRFSLALQTWLNDWFDEEDQYPGAAHRDKAETLLAEAQAALNLLHSYLPQAVARHSQTHAQWLQALAQSQALAELIDDDLRAGLQAAAETKQAQLTALRERVQLLNETVGLSEAALNRLRSATEALQFRLDQARKHRATLATRGQLVELLMDLERLDRELGRDAGLIEESLQGQAAEVFRKEDRLAAREEWKRK